MKEEIENRIRKLEESLFVAHPALVKNVDSESMRAKVELKTKKDINGEEVDTPVIHNVPITHHKSETFMDRKLPESGDPCWVVFFDRDIDKVIKNLEKSSPDTDRVHDENDAILVGEWTADSEDIPSELGSMSGDDWLLGLHRDNGSRIYIRSGGNIVLHPGSMNQIELVEDAKYSVALFEKILQKYLTHQHVDPLSGSTGPPMTGIWTMQQGSDKVKVDG